MSQRWPHDLVSEKLSKVEGPFVGIGNTDGRTKLEKKIRSCVQDLFERVPGCLRRDAMRAAEREPVFKGKVLAKDTYSGAIRILMAFDASGHMPSPRSQDRRAKF